MLWGAAEAHGVGGITQSNDHFFCVLLRAVRTLKQQTSHLKRWKRDEKWVINGYHLAMHSMPWWDFVKIWMGVRTKHLFKFPTRIYPRC